MMRKTNRNWSFYSVKNSLTFSERKYLLFSSAATLQVINNWYTHIP